MPEAIADLSRETGVSIGSEGSLPHRRTPAIHGRYDIGEALERLLTGSGYIARRVGASAWRIVRAPAPPPPHPAPPDPVAPPAAEGTWGTIIVTAVKRSQPLSDLPMAASVVMLDNSLAHGAASGSGRIASEIEGLAMTGLGPGRNRMFLRGVADSAFSGESQSTVAVLLDEARLTYAAPDPDLRLIDMERVEVLKGPQGSLYGTGALGGIYHLVTHSANLVDPSLAVSLGGEVVNGGNAGFSTSAIANVPVLQERVGLRLVGYGSKEPGWIDSGSRKNDNSGRVLGARAGLGIDAGDGWRLDLTGLGQWSQSHDSRYTYQRHTLSRPEQRAEPHDNDLRHVAARLGREVGGLDINLSSAMTWHDVTDHFDATIGADNFGLPHPGELVDQHHYRVWDTEARVSARTGAIDWLIGLSHIEARQDLISTLYAAHGPDSLVTDDDRRKTRESALFGDVAVPLTGRLRFNLGARLFRSIIDESRPAAIGRITGRATRSGVTPSAALSWRPHRGRLIFLRYGSAIRQGGTDVSSDGLLDRLHGDELSTIELGWREELAGGGRAELGLSYARWKNLQSDRLKADSEIETENAGNARIMSLEASLEQPIAHGWRLSAGGAFTSANLIRNELGYHLKDTRLPVVPRFTLRGALRHDFALGQADGWASLQLRYNGPARLSFDPTLDRRMGEVLESRLEFHVTSGATELSLVAENLLNRQSDSFAYGNPLRLATMPQYTPQEPRSVSLSVLQRF